MRRPMTKALAEIQAIAEGKAGAKKTKSEEISKPKPRWRRRLKQKKWSKQQCEK